MARNDSDLPKGKNKITLNNCQERMTEIFMKYLHDETLLHKTKRTTFVLQKLAFTTALFGIAALQLIPIGIISQNIQIPINNGWILYVIPIIAISYDVYIYAEDYKIKRIGYYIRNNSLSKKIFCEIEIEWQKYVEKRREPLSIFPTMTLTIFTSIVAYFIARSQYNNMIDVIILLIGVTIPIILYVYYKLYLVKKL